MKKLNSYDLPCSHFRFVSAADTCAQCFQDRIKSPSLIFVEAERITGLIACNIWIRTSVIYEIFSVRDYVLPPSSYAVLFAAIRIDWNVLCFIILTLQKILFFKMFLEFVQLLKGDFKKTSIKTDCRRGSQIWTVKYRKISPPKYLNYTILFCFVEFSLI